MYFSPFPGNEQNEEKYVGRKSLGNFREKPTRITLNQIISEKTNIFFWYEL